MNGRLAIVLALSFLVVGCGSLKRPLADETLLNCVELGGFKRVDRTGDGFKLVGEKGSACVWVTPSVTVTGAPLRSCTIRRSPYTTEQVVVLNNELFVVQ